VTVGLLHLPHFFQVLISSKNQTFPSDHCSNLSPFSLEALLSLASMKLATFTINLYSLLTLRYATGTMDVHEDLPSPVAITDQSPVAEITLQDRSGVALTSSFPNGPPICCQDMAQGWQWVLYACATAASQELALGEFCYIDGNTCKSLSCYGGAEVVLCNDVCIGSLFPSPHKSPLFARNLP
jgi:hypothetical protein